MKKNAVVFFFKSLLKSILVIASVLAVGVISYQVSYGVLSRQAEDGKLEIEDDELEDILKQTETDEISKNLIYVVNDKKKIKHMILEICNTNTCNMDYVTIPVTSDYTIPNAMYQKLCVIDEEVPQIVHFSKLRQYFPSLEDEEAYGYAELIVEKMLGIKISYFTVMTTELYKSQFEKRKMTTVYKVAAQPEETSDPEATPSASPGASRGKVTMKLSVYSDSHINMLKTLFGDKHKIKEYIEEQYKEEGYFSNLTVYSKIGYAPVYEKSNPEYFHYWGLPGEYQGKVFEVDEASAGKFIKQLQNNTTAYTESQALEKTTSTTSKKKQISSKGKDIIILNGSRIAGLATSKQEELVNAGFTVPKVGDYQDEVLTRTRITVPKKNMGSDLAKYFKEPEIVVGNVEGYDIEIILGTVDAN